ncbi:HAD-IA family hydrolase [Comamonas sp. GB3 AK4-5]|uniref:HAD-IA family hydrolase n=1 Tax=Comamonas sp. GB3 AK4-5 TaxID=3231487 RepID=UPI00351E3762
MHSIKFKALLFDMDGTLVESTSEVEKIWGQWCRQHGIPLPSVLEICHGVRSQDVIAQVAPQLDVLEECRRLEEMELASAVSQALPGACEFLQGLGDAPWAVVTSACRPVALQRMKRSGLPEPRLLIGSGDVQKGKPDPEPYTTAAYRLGMAPSDCLVFEDAPAGIQSALDAGCQVIQIGSCPINRAGVYRAQYWGQLMLGSNKNEVFITD